MPPGDLKKTIHTQSEKIIQAQRPVRILNAIKWNENVRKQFFASQCRQQPVVDVDYYHRIPLGFEPTALRETFHEIKHDIEQQLGTHPAGFMMAKMCHEYARVIDMLEARGTPAFSQISTELYGSANAGFHKGSATLADLGKVLDRALCNIDEHMFLESDPAIYSTTEAIYYLQHKLDKIFDNPAARVNVIESDGIVADAAAGSDYIKLRKHARFSQRDIRVLEVHEGWVHVGTTLNGQLQPVCTFLSKGTPSDTITQEGLAVFIEVISFASHPARLRRIVDRIRAIHMVDEGANFLEVFNKLTSEGRCQEEAYNLTMRIFRGSTPTGGAFAKDLVYARGFIQVYNFIRLAVKRGKLNRIPLLFCGKFSLADMHYIVQLLEEGLVVQPRYLPPPILDLNALTAWMAFSNFLNRLDLGKIETEFQHLLD